MTGWQARTRVAALALLLASAVAQAELGPADFVERCRDGDACDYDRRVDGICTFGRDNGFRHRVPAGGGSKMANELGAVGQFDCIEASAPPPPEPR